MNASSHPSLRWIRTGRLRVARVLTFLVWSLAVGLLGVPVMRPLQAAGAAGAEERRTGDGSAAALPGGSLEAHERAGGHLLARHVGKSAEQLRQRLENDSRISAASSFTDKKTAETAVTAAVSANQKKITSWLKGDDDRLVITYRSSTPVGISVGRSSSRARDATGVRLVLVRDTRFNGGWRILTGYPET